MRGFIFGLMSQPQRIVFMGTPHFACPALATLIQSPHEVVGVFSQPPRPAGRGKKVQKSPVHLLAESHDISVYTPEKLKGDAIEALQQIAPDIICVAAYGLLLPQKVLDIAPCLNIHPSALPRWRGAAPIQHTVLAGDATTDVCIMQMEKGLDTGPVYLRETFEVGENETSGELHDRLAAEGARLLLNTINHWPNVTATTQGESGIVYAHKITPDMRAINWRNPAQEVHNHIRGLTPWPGATASHNNMVLKLLNSRISKGTGQPGEVLNADANGVAIACGDGAVTIHTLQRPGKRAVTSNEFLQGYTLKAGDILA